MPKPSVTAHRGAAIAQFVAGARHRDYPPEVIDAAKKALVDFVGVAIGAIEEPLAVALRRTVLQWRAAGDAPIILGERTTPALAALVNGTMVHAVEYDDQNPNGSGHPSAPCWSAALAIATHHHLTERDALAGFIVGYEITAKLGGGGPSGVGRTMQKLGFHPTSIFGRMGAAGAACSMLGLDESRIAHAMGIAATTAGGLLGSFGTHCKPFHAGKAAMDGILAAQLAAEGFEGATNLFELERGLLDAFIQDGQAEVPPLDFGQSWDLLRNGFKYYACCRATHSSTQAACTLAERVTGKKIARIVARVHANALVTAAIRNPRTPFECKFSVPFCIALGLRGHKALMTDFTEATLRDASVMELLPLVEMEAVDGQDSQTAHLDVYLEDGGHLQANTSVTKGHPDNPMSWDDLFTKYLAMVEPRMGGQKAAELYEHLANFDRPGSLRKSAILLSRVAPD